MTNAQRALLDLLEEFNCLCEECGANYSLIEHDLLWAHRTFDIAGCELEVLMSWPDYQKLEACIQAHGSSDREIESLETNHLMPGWYFRYVNSATTMLMLDYARVRKAHGIGINIHIARKPLPSKRHVFAWTKRKLLTLVERGMAQGIYPDYQLDKNYKTRVHKVAGATAKAMRTVMGEARFASWASNALSKTAATDLDSETSILSPTSGTNHILPRRFLLDLEWRRLSGTRALVAHDREPYLERRFGDARNGRRHSIWYRREEYMTFSSVNVAYGDFLPRINDIISDESFFRNREKWLIAYHYKIAPERTAQMRRWDLFYFIGDRFKCWERFIPHKQAILRWFEEGKYDLLWMYLKPYILKINRYAAKGLPLVIDEDLWNTVLELFRLNGYVRHVEVLEALHDEKPLPPITNAQAFSRIDAVKRADLDLSVSLLDQ